MRRREWIRWRFVKWLHASYSQGGAIGHFLALRVTPVAWMVVGLLLLTVIMGGNFVLSAVILLGALLGGVLMTSAIWAALRRGQVKVWRHLPRTGVVGQPLRYEVEVEVLKKRKLKEVRLLEVGDDPRPALDTFYRVQEPGEEKRNAFDRVFIYYRWKWLVERSGRWDDSEASEPVDLVRGEPKKVTLEVTPKRRGVFAFYDLRLVLRDPLGLFQRCRKSVRQEKQEVLVLPEWYRLPGVVFRGSGELVSGGEASISQRGDGEELLGLRGYRPGDSRRQIHWKSWARTGSPVVKELEENRLSRCGLVLDTGLEESDEECLEEAVRVAASLVRGIEAGESELEALFFESDSGAEVREKAAGWLEQLAPVEAVEAVNYTRLARQIGQRAGGFQAVVVVLTGWGASRRRFLQRLAQMGVEVRALAVLRDGQGEVPKGWPTEPEVVRLTSAEADVRRICQESLG